MTGVPQLGRFGAYLARALDMLNDESPPHFLAVRSRLAGRAVTIRVAGDVSVRVCLEAEAPWVTRPDASAPAEVEIATSEADLHAFLRGDFTLEEGLEAGRLAVRGELDHVLAFLEGLTAWLHGAL